MKRRRHKNRAVRFVHKTHGRFEEQQTNMFIESVKCFSEIH